MDSDQELKRTKELLQAYRVIVELKDEVAELKEGKRTLRYTNASLLEENKRYKEALEFYADPENHKQKPCGIGKASEIELDGGTKAKVTLQEKDISVIVHKDGTVEKIPRDKLVSHLLFQ